MPLPRLLAGFLGRYPVLVSRYDIGRERPFEIYESARKHGISDEDIRHAVTHALVVADEQETSKVLYLGPDRAGNLLEIVTTDENLQKMADEAEAGVDVTKLRRRPGRPLMGSGPAGTLPVRLEPELRKAVDDRAAREHTSASDVVREALRRYLKMS